MEQYATTLQIKLDVVRFLGQLIKLISKSEDLGFYSSNSKDYSINFLIIINQ
jgi:hypothetical protein